MAGIQENDKTYYSLDEKEREWEDTVDKRIGTLIDNQLKILGIIEKVDSGGEEYRH